MEASAAGKAPREAPRKMEPPREAMLLLLLLRLADVLAPGVARALVRVREHVIRLGNVPKLELKRRALVLIFGHVGVKLARGRAVRALDGAIVGVARQRERAVVVLHLRLLQRGVGALAEVARVVRAAVEVGGAVRVAHGVVPAAAREVHFAEQQVRLGEAVVVVVRNLFDRLLVEFGVRVTATLAIRRLDLRTRDMGGGNKNKK